MDNDNDNAQDPGTGTGRQPVTHHILGQRVAAFMSAAAALGSSYTAYEITLDLRANYPNDEIVHDDVRRLVQALYRAYSYTDTFTDFGTYEATLYSPIVHDQDPTDGGSAQTTALPSPPLQAQAEDPPRTLQASDANSVGVAVSPGPPDTSPGAGPDLLPGIRPLQTT